MPAGTEPAYVTVADLEFVNAGGPLASDTGTISLTNTTGASTCGGCEKP